MGKKGSAHEISILAIFSALILLQNYLPMIGYITIGALPAITTIHLTIIIGAVILGPRDGAILGGFWGILSMIRAFTSPDSLLSQLLFTNPITAIVPRIMVGLIAGLVAGWLLRTKLPKVISLSITGLVSALVNTAMVILFATLFIGNDGAKVVGTVAKATVNTGNLMGTMIIMLGFNAILEATLAAVVTPLVSIPLLRFKK